MRRLRGLKHSDKEAWVSNLAISMVKEFKEKKKGKRRQSKMRGRTKQQSKKSKKQNKKMDGFSDSPVDADMEGTAVWLVLALHAGWWDSAGMLTLFAR